MRQLLQSAAEIITECGSYYKVLQLLHNAAVHTALLPTIATLQGKTTVKTRSKLEDESINIWIVCLCEPGGGKRPALKIACEEPVREYLEVSKYMFFLFISITFMSILRLRFPKN